MPVVLARSYTGRASPQSGTQAFASAPLASVITSRRRISPLGRIGTAEELANLACFLASEQGSFTSAALPSMSTAADPGWSGDEVCSRDFGRIVLQRGQAGPSALMVT
jgi:NAD(P)-dependent dehydrogenase (short-subunit alcohol dehydrogenase family)